MGEHNYNVPNKSLLPTQIQPPAAPPRPSNPEITQSRVMITLSELENHVDNTVLQNTVFSQPLNDSEDNIIVIEAEHDSNNNNMNNGGEMQNITKDDNTQNAKRATQATQLQRSLNYQFSNKNETHDRFVDEINTMYNDLLKKHDLIIGNYDYNFYFIHLIYIHQKITKKRSFKSQFI